MIFIKIWIAVGLLISTLFMMPIIFIKSGLCGVFEDIKLSLRAHKGWFPPKIKKKSK